MDLADARCGEWFRLEMLEVVEKIRRRKAFQEFLRVFLWNGGGSAVQSLELNATLWVNQIRTEGEDLAEFDRQQAHGLDRVDINRLLAFDLPEEPQEGNEFHGVTRSIDQFNGVQFMAVNEVAPQVVFVATSVDTLNDDIRFFGKAG